VEGRGSWIGCCGTLSGSLFQGGHNSWEEDEVLGKGDEKDRDRDITLIIKNHLRAVLPVNAVDCGFLVDGISAGETWIPYLGTSFSAVGSGVQG
jgi:hypothetical protein